MITSPIGTPFLVFTPCCPGLAVVMSLPTGSVLPTGPYTVFHYADTAPIYYDGSNNAQLIPGNCYTVTYGIGSIPLGLTPGPLFANFDGNVKFGCGDADVCGCSALPCLCSRATNTTNTTQPLRYIDCSGNINFTPNLAPGETSLKYCVASWTTGDNIEYFGDCINEVCPTPACYTAYPCDGSISPFNTLTDLSAYADANVPITFVEHPSVCFLIFENTSSNCLDPQVVTFNALGVGCCETNCYYVNTGSITYVDINGTLLDATAPFKFCSEIYPIVDSIQGVVVTEFGLCIDGLCQDSCYILTDCAGLADPIYTTSQSVLPFLNTTTAFKINGYTNCWTVAITEDNCDCAINIVITTSYKDCEACAGYTSYKLTDCSNSANVMYTSTDLSPYVNAVIEQDCPGCWYVEEFFLQPPSDTAITVTNVFDNCTTCGYTYYRLFDCAGKAEDIITTTDLSLLLNDIITLDWCPETCWQIEITRDHINATTVFIKNKYSTCNTCYIDVLPCTCQTAKLVNPCVGYILTLPPDAGDITYTECDGTVITENYTNAFPFILEFCGPSGQTFMSPIITEIDLSVECNFLSWIDCEGRRRSSADPVYNNGVSPKMCIKQWLMPEGQYEYTIYGDCINNNSVFECPVVPQLTRTVRPGYNTPTCTINHYEKIACSFAEAMYSNALEKRYGITSCCSEDKEKWELQWELTELATLVQATPTIAPNPPFPPFPPPPVLKCVKYNFTIFAPLGATIYYLDCNSEVTIISIPAAKQNIIPPICGIEGQTATTIYAIGGLNFSFTETAILC